MEETSVSSSQDVYFILLGSGGFVFSPSSPTPEAALEGSGETVPACGNGVLRAARTTVTALLYKIYP